MTKKFVFRSNKYNITHQDIQRGIEDRGYINENYGNSNETDPLNKWHLYRAERNDQNIFVSSSTNITRMQIHDAVNRLYNESRGSTINISVEKEQDLYVGYNFNKQKLYAYVEDYLLNNPAEAVNFIKDPNQFLVNIPGLNIKNILIYQGGIDKNNTTLPFLKTNGGEIVGHHKDGKFEKGLQGPFNESNVGGFKHRHQIIGTQTDRPERYIINDNGSNIIISSPLSGSSGLNYNTPYSRFSRDNFTKSVVNIKNIKATGSNSLGNFSKNYQIVNGLNRRSQNLALIDRPQNFVFNNIDSPYVSGVVDYALPDRRLLDGTYNKTSFVNKFGAPGDINSTNPAYMDAESEEYSPYNTVNYRNAAPRTYLKSFLSTPSYFGGYKSSSFGISASYQKAQRNNRYVPVSGTSNFILRADNGYINFNIPARDGGYLWIKSYTTGGNNPGLYVNGIDNDIRFVTSAADNLYFNKISSSYVTISTSSMVLNSSENNVLRKFNIQYNGLWNYSSKQQLSQNYNSIIVGNKKQNYFADNINDPTLRTKNKLDIRVKDSFIKDKHTNTTIIYSDEQNIVEELSIPLGQNYNSLVSDVYISENNQNINLYRDQKNIKTSNKEKSLFKKLINFDRYAKENNLNIKKIKQIKHQEKIYPRSQNTYRNFARVRNAYSQSWADSLDNRLTEITNSQGQVYVRTAFLNKESGGTEYKFSYWPMDANLDPNYPGAIVRDKSGELLQLDNINFYYTLYGVDPGLIVPSGSYFGARFNRNWNINRPANVVHEQAGKGPYHDTYQDFYSDIKLMGQNCSILPEYRISPKLDSYYSGATSFYDDSFNTLELTGTIIDDYNIAISTSSAFLEQRVLSDHIDLNQYMNEELSEYKLNSIKFKIKTIKKLLPYDQFYPQNRMLKLAQQISSSYAKIFNYGGSQATFRTVLTPFYAPGIGFNSVKAGISMPFSIVYSSSSDIYSGNLSITSSLSNASSYFYKMPWESIIYPYKNILVIPKTPGETVSKIYDVDYSMRIDSTASIRNPSTDLSISFNRTYDFMANNFYAEVINFFKKDNKLTSIESISDNEWYFPDLTKKYSVDIFINKSNNFTTYTGLEGYGTKPYHFHLPPWHRVPPATAIDPSSDLNTTFAPNNAYYQLQASARITFDPGLISSSSPQYFAGGKFTFDDLKKYSTIQYSSYVTNEDPSLDPTSVVNVGDLIEIFSFSDSNRTWKPRVNWECPTADLNFYNLSAKLTNSSGNDSGDGVAGNAIRGIWHQYGSATDNQTGLFINTKFVPDDRNLTGSLLDVVKFDTTKVSKVGEVTDFNEISEAIIILPFYTDECGKEKYFDVGIEKFEEMYQNNFGIVGQIKDISRKYNLPPQLDYVRFRDLKNKPLEKREYGLVKSPFLMFAFEFSSVLTKTDLLNIWQGVMPDISMTAEEDYLEKEFFIGEYLDELNYKLPNNTRFKVFKAKKRAITNYQQIIDKTNNKEYIDLNYGYNWPYDFCSLAEMAEIQAEMNYGYDIEKDIERVSSETLSKDITSLSMDGGIVRGGRSGAPISVLRVARTAERVASRTTSTQTSREAELARLEAARLQRAASNVDSSTLSSFSPDIARLVDTTRESNRTSNVSPLISLLASDTSNTTTDRTRNTNDNSALALLGTQQNQSSDTENRNSSDVSSGSGLTNLINSLINN